MTSTAQGRKEGTARCQWVAVLAAALAAGFVSWWLVREIRLGPGETGIVATAVFLSVTLAARLLVCRPRDGRTTPSPEAAVPDAPATGSRAEGARDVAQDAARAAGRSAAPRPRRGAAAALEAVLEGAEGGMRLPPRPSGGTGEVSGEDAGQTSRPMPAETAQGPVDPARHEVVPSRAEDEKPSASVPAGRPEGAEGGTRPPAPPAPGGGNDVEGGEKAMSEEEKAPRRKLADVELPDAEPLPTILPPEVAGEEDEPDDLTLISGVDEDIAIELYAFGLTRFEHFAQLGPMRIKRLAAMLPEHVGVNEVRNWKKAAIAMARSFGRFPKEEAGAGKENDKTAEGGTTPEQGDQNRERET